MKIGLALLGWGALSLSPALSSAPATPAGALKTSSCRVGQSHAAAICGTLTVFEDRSAGSGRTIGIYFIDIKAKHTSDRAIVFNPGGPGASATELAPDFADATSGAIATLRDHYDILLVDNRGTGKSAPQQCNFAPAERPELFFSQVWPDAIVDACRARLAANANLSLYTTSMATDDLNDVRAALGYPKLVLYGGSYGTIFYLDYVRRHPETVESVVLEGVGPPHFYVIPLPMARGAQTAMAQLEQTCSQDPTCTTHFPDFGQHFAAVVQRFDAGPVGLTVRNPVTHLPQTVQLTKEVFAETVRHELYFQSGAAYMPVTIERAYHGDYTPLAEMVSQMALLFANIQANGLNLSVSCSEDIPFITEADVAAYSAGTFEGDVRVYAQQRACKIWDVAPAPASFQEPVHSDAPILMISGSDDPATPPQYGQQALAYLPNGRQMLVPGASHDSDLPPCVDAIIVAFISARSASGLDLVHCATKYKRPSFVTLAYDEPAAGENTALTKRLTAILDEIMRGRIDRSQLTPSASKKFPDAMLKGLASDFAGLGDLQAIVFKETSGSGKARIYSYLMRFERGNVLATFTLESSGPISDIDLSG
ncbi:MAG TPA: alpha/beta fold hydrolase [Candidatus Cybelea sp.]|jgi:pimeloyl-ACP methyl ester carboxylesterase|nr:alpha/beta fold hydrolase [Candidatus Cybelea sp.]